jgi:hypothetical protein
VPQIECAIDSVDVKDENAIANYTLHRTDGGEGKAPIPIFDGETLTADHLNGRRGALFLTFEEGEWKVVGTKFPINEQGAGPVVMWSAASPVNPSLPQVDTFKSLTAVDRKQWDRAWQTDFNARNQPARTVLSQLLSSLNLTLSPEVDKLPALEKPVTLELRGRSRLEALEALCHQIDMHPGIQNGTLYLLPGPRTQPMTFTGPFLIEVAGINETPRWGTGYLSLRCWSAFASVEAAHILGMERQPAIFAQVTSADGRDLLFPVEDAPHANFAFSSPADLKLTPQATSVQLELKGLIREMDAIHRIQGRIVVSLPVRVDTFTFDHLFVGITQQKEERRITIQKVFRPVPESTEKAALPTANQLPIQIEFQTQGLDGHRIQFAAYDPSGKSVKVGASDTQVGGLVSLSVPQAASAISLKTYVIEDVSYEFEFHDVPLINRPPRQIEPARFPGHDSPITAEFVGFTQRSAAGVNVRQVAPVSDTPTEYGGIRLRLKNHSQKIAKMVWLKFAYVDTQQRGLGEGNTMHRWISNVIMRSPIRYFPDGPDSNGPIQIDVDVQNVQVPPHSSSVRATVTKVQFTDGTSWVR